MRVNVGMSASSGIESTYCSDFVDEQHLVHDKHATHLRLEQTLALDAEGQTKDEYSTPKVQNTAQQHQSLEERPKQHVQVAQICLIFDFRKVAQNGSARAGRCLAQPPMESLQARLIQVHKGSPRRCTAGC